MVGLSVRSAIWLCLCLRTLGQFAVRMIETQHRWGRPGITNLDVNDATAHVRAPFEVGPR